MAGQSGRNLKIAKSRLGCRLPFESVAVGDGYASAGPLMVRKMTPEEIAQYGPPRPRLEGNKFHARIVQALKMSRSPEEAAELLGMTVGKLKQYMGANGVHYRWPKIKAEEVSEDMKAVHMSEAEAVEKLPPAVLERIKSDQIPGQSDQNSALAEVPTPAERDIAFMPTPGQSPMLVQNTGPSSDRRTWKHRTGCYDKL